MPAKPDKGLYLRYSPARLGAAKLDLISKLGPIVAEYENAGYAVSVRQIYYQMVSTGQLPNSPRSYDMVQGALNDGRMAGLISWTAIEDRGRNLRGLGYQTSVAGALRKTRAGYLRDLWADQPWRPEVWIEKDSLIGVIGGICNRLRVDFFSCHGYNSQSEQWAAGRRFAGYVQKGQRPIVLHLGDHDPSGVDMTRDNRDRLSMFAGTPVLVQRLALNMPQIEELSLPPFWAKVTDSRAAGYIAQYGDHAWELDALRPQYMEKIIEDAVRRLREPAEWEAAMARENEDQREFDELIAQTGDDNDRD